MKLKDNSGESVYSTIAIIGIGLFIAPAFINEKMQNSEIEYFEHKKIIELISSELQELREESNELRERVDSDIKKSLMNIPEMESIASELENYIAGNKDYNYSVIDYSMSEEEVYNIAFKELEVVLNNLKDQGVEIGETKALLHQSYLKSREINKKVIEVQYEIEKADVRLKYIRQDIIFDYLSRAFGIALLVVGLYLLQKNNKVKSNIRKKKSNNRFNRIIRPVMVCAASLRSLHKPRQSRITG